MFRSLIHIKSPVYRQSLIIILIGNKGYSSFTIKTQYQIPKCLQHCHKLYTKTRRNICVFGKQRSKHWDNTCHCVNNTRKPKDSRDKGTMIKSINNRAERSSSFYKPLLQSHGTCIKSTHSDSWDGRVKRAAENLPGEQIRQDHETPRKLLK